MNHELLNWLYGLATFLTVVAVLTAGALVREWWLARKVIRK